MENQKLYVLYLLHTAYKEDKLEQKELNSLMLSAYDCIDNQVDNKEMLIAKLKDSLKIIFTDNKTINFKIGDIIKTEIGSALIELEFHFENVQGKYFITIFEEIKKVKKLVAKVPL